MTDETYPEIEALVATLRDRDFDSPQKGRDKGWEEDGAVSASRSVVV